MFWLFCSSESCRMWVVMKSDCFGGVLNVVVDGGDGCGIVVAAPGGTADYRSM